MSIINGIQTFTSAMEAKSIPYAIIGGLAVFAYGGERTTFDVDFLIHGDHRETIKKIAEEQKFTIVNENKEVMQFGGKIQVDVVFANRLATQEMLTRTRTVGQLPYPVVGPEDLIGLKIQGFTGDRSREFNDKGDILTLFKNVPHLNFDKIKEYADIFNVWNEIVELRKHI